MASEVFNTIELANKMLILLPELFGAENADKYDELSANILETSILEQPIDNEDGTLCDYVAFSEKGHYGDGKIGLYKITRSWDYNPFDENNNVYRIAEILPFEERRVRSMDSKAGTITFIGVNDVDLVYDCIEERWIEP